MTSPKSPARRRFPLPLDQLRGAEGATVSRTDVQRPQRMVQGAVADAGRQRTPVGLGLDSQTVRSRMAGRLRSLGVADERVLAAFARVERHRFVDSALANQAYEDTSLPIGFGQTISKPSIVAQMLQALLEARPPTGAGSEANLCRPPILRCVLEIGTGCGYQAALLAGLAERVVSIERVGALAERARANLAASMVRNVHVIHGDGRLGAPALGPFDAIVSAAGGDELPAAWLEQLAVGGRLVAPGAELRAGVQELVVVDRHPSGVTRRLVGEVYFVPLKSGAE